MGIPSSGDSVQLGFRPVGIPSSGDSVQWGFRPVGIPSSGDSVQWGFRPVGIPSSGDSVQWGFRPVGIPGGNRFKVLNPRPAPSTVAFSLGCCRTAKVALFILSRLVLNFSYSGGIGS